MRLDSEVVIINFTFDYNKRYEIPEMELCNPNKKQLALIKNVQDLKITMRFLNCSELSFTAYSEINGQKTPYFDKLEKNRLIHVEGFGYFVIYEYTQKYEDRVYSKEIVAYSAEFLLNNKGINLVFVTSPDDSTKVYSKSYKFWDELDRAAAEPVSLLGNLLKVAPQWSVGRVSTSLWNQYRSFSETNDGLYGFLNNTVSESYEALFIFDFENFEIDVYDTTEIIKKTDIMLTFDNILKNAEIEELNNDVYTVLNVKGAENLSIARINPLGTKQIFKLDYYVGSLDPESGNYYKNYNAWIEDENLRYKVLNWQKTVKELTESSGQEGSYGFLLAQQNRLNMLKLTQEAEYTDTKTDNESEQMLMSDYLDDLTSRTESGKTTRYNYHKKKQYAYEYNMNVLKSGGRLYDMSNDSQFDSDSALGDPTGQQVLTSVPLPPSSSAKYSIDAITAKIEEVNNQRESIVNTYAYDKYFTADEQIELEPYIREGEYQDSTFIITDNMDVTDYSNGETWVETTNGIKQIKDLLPTDTVIDSNYVAQQLLEAGYKKAETVCQPSFSFSLDAINFFFVEEFKKFAGQMQFGAMINVELSEGDWVYPYFQEAVIDYENPDSFSLTFGNRFRLSNAEWTWDELHNSTSNAVSSVNSLLTSVSQPVTNGTIDRVTSYMQNALTAANQEIQATSDNEFTFGGYGIRGRKKSTEVPNYNGYSGEQIWLSNNRICFTDDGWNTSKMVFGKVSSGAYGVVADVIVGKLIAGNNLVISNSTDDGEATFYVDGEGARLTNSSLLFQKTGSDAFIKINIDDGIVANDGTNDVLVFDILDGVSTIRCKNKVEFITSDFTVQSDNFRVSPNGDVWALGTFVSQTAGYNSSGGVQAALSSSSDYLNSIGGYSYGLTSGVALQTRDANSGDKNVFRMGSCTGTNSSFGYLELFAAGISQLEFNGAYAYGRISLKDGTGGEAVVLSGQRENYVSIDCDEGVAVHGTYGVQVDHGVSCQDLNAWGSKKRIVQTSFGWNKLHAFETPQASFADIGTGKFDESGVCYICLDPRFAESISKYQELKWFVSSSDSSGCYVVKNGTSAEIHGKPNSSFDWMCVGVQNGYEEYADVFKDGTPLPLMDKKERIDSYRDEIIKDTKFFPDYFGDLEQGE